MTEEIMEQVKIARKEAEAEIGFSVPDDFANDVLELCKRKCVCAKKDEDYLPIMYRFELPTKVSAALLNEYSMLMQSIKKGDEMYVQCLSPNALSSTVPLCT